MNTYTVGVDVGGTNIKLGIVSSAGKIIAKTRLATKGFGSHKTQFIDALVAAIQKLLKKRNLSLRQVRGIGIGLPGLIDPRQGTIIQLPNIPGWKNVSLVKLLKKKLNVPIYIENDVNLITLAEWKYGAGRGFTDLVCITLGTGVGGGLIFNNGLYRGSGFAAGEIGHMPIEKNGIACPCGGRGCFERYVGNAYLLQKIRKIFRRENMRIQDVFILANRGNKQALMFWKEFGQTLGFGLTGVVNLLNPQAIVIGGGVSNNFKFFAPAVRDVLKKRCMKVQGKMAKILRARFSHDAGILGAHVLVKETKFGS